MSSAFPGRKTLDRQFPADPELHLVTDNDATHKEPHVQAWLKKHPRFVLHFIPTSSSWLNQVERWFGELTQKAVRRGVFVSVEELQKAVGAFLDAWNEAPRPFVWTAAVQLRLRVALFAECHQGCKLCSEATVS